jgi:hypothetical protein
VSYVYTSLMCFGYYNFAVYFEVTILSILFLIFIWHMVVLKILYFLFFYYTEIS